MSADSQVVQKINAGYCINGNCFDIDIRNKSYPHIVDDDTVCLCMTRNVKHLKLNAPFRESPDSCDSIDLESSINSGNGPKPVSYFVCNFDNYMNIHISHCLPFRLAQFTPEYTKSMSTKITRN